jgi:hypothetical protein
MIIRINRHFSFIILLIFSFLIENCKSSMVKFDSCIIDLQKWRNCSELKSFKLGILLKAYTFKDDYCNDTCMFSNVYICTSNLGQGENVNDTIVVFEIYDSNPIDTLLCPTCKDCILELKSIAIKSCFVKKEFFFSQFNDCNRYKYIIGKLKLLID